MSGSTPTSPIRLFGSCHCGRVGFQVQVDSKVLDVLDCNCSVCTKKGYLHYIAPGSRFTWVGNREDASLYTFGTHTAKHYFCKVCGISPFYVPRSNPDGWDINARCFDDGQSISMNVTTFDGKSSWDSEAKAIEHLSKG